MSWLDRITESIDVKFEQTAGDSEGQGSQVCCSPWGHKGLTTTGKRCSENTYRYNILSINI